MSSSPLKNLPVHPKGGSYPDATAAILAMNEAAVGYAVVKQRSDLRKIFLTCRKGGIAVPSTASMCNAGSRKIGCPFSIVDEVSNGGADEEDKDEHEEEEDVHVDQDEDDDMGSEDSFVKALMAVSCNCNDDCLNGNCACWAIGSACRCICGCALRRGTRGNAACGNDRAMLKDI